jgi:aminoglycoside/choline kinase family phosphotransferase
MRRRKTSPFVKVAGLFGDTGVTVPKVLAQDAERGFLLLSDLGSTTYLSQLSADSAHALYMDAIEALVLYKRKASPRRCPNMTVRCCCAS